MRGKITARQQKTAAEKKNASSHVTLVRHWCGIHEQEPFLLKKYGLLKVMNEMKNTLKLKFIFLNKDSFIFKENLWVPSFWGISCLSETLG